MIGHSLTILADRPECPGRLQRHEPAAKRTPQGRRQFGPCLREIFRLSLRLRRGVRDGWFGLRFLRPRPGTVTMTASDVLHELLVADEFHPAVVMFDDGGQALHPISGRIHGGPKRTESCQTSALASKAREPGFPAIRLPNPAFIRLVPQPTPATRAAFIMGKTLIIAEKPSVMTDLSRALAKPLGKFEKQGSGRDAYFENDNAVITSAVGHLVELRMPMGPNGKKLPWNFQVLPAIPEHFDLDPIPDIRSPPQAGPQARQAQGHRPHRQCLRRRPRGRTDLPLHHGNRQNPQARPAALDAVDDQQRHPRSMGAPPQRRANAAPGRCRPVPLRVRLARRPQRDPRVHLLQLPPRRLQHHRRRPRPDADARHPRRPRGGNPAPSSRPPISRSTPPSASRPANIPASGSTKRGKRTRPPRSPGPSASGTKPPPSHQRPLRGQNRHRFRGKESADPDRPAALRPHHPPARGSVFRQGHPPDRPGAL